MTKYYTIEQLEELTPNELNMLLFDEINKKQVDIQYVKNLMNAGASLEAKNNAGWTATPLHLAINKGLIKVVKELINTRANIDTQDGNGWTALHLAANNGQIEAIGILIASGASKEALTNNGSTPWDVAIPRVKEAIPKLNPKYRG